MIRWPAMQIRLLLLLLAFAAFPNGASALTADREQPVRIDADWANLDDQRRIATYKGDVVILQGSLRITGDVVTMHFTESYDLLKLVAEGKPARYQQQLDDGTRQEGQAERIEYGVHDGAMLFAGKARVTQGEFKMDADRIDYDSTTGSIEAAGTDTESEERRVTIILKREQK